MPWPHKAAMWTLWSCYRAQFRGDLVLCLFPQWHLQALHYLLTSVNTEQSVPGGWHPIEGQVCTGSSVPAVHDPWTMATVCSHPASSWVMRHSVQLCCFHATCHPLPLDPLGLTPGHPFSHHSLSPALTIVSLFLSFSLLTSVLSLGDSKVFTFSPLLWRYSIALSGTAQLADLTSGTINTGLGQWTISRGWAHLVSHGWLLPRWQLLPLASSAASHCSPGTSVACFVVGWLSQKAKTGAELLTSSHFTARKLPPYHIRKHHHLLLWFYSSYSSHNTPRPPLHF